MNTFNPNKKRKRVVDQYKDSFISPPQLVSTVNPISGSVFWKCDSSSEHKNYDIALTNNDGKMQFLCSCQKSGSYHCKHIHAVIIKMCLTHVENSVDHLQEVIDLKTDLDDVADKLDSVVKITE